MNNCRFSKPIVSILLLASLVLFISGPSVAQLSWQKVGEEELPKDKKTQEKVESAKYFELNFNELKNELNSVSNEQPKPLQQYGKVFSLPTPDGATQKFLITAYSMMEAPLSRKYPEIRTFYGQGLDDPTATITLDYNYLGFHALVMSEKGNFKIEPVFLDDTRWYSVFTLNTVSKHFDCGVEHNENKNGSQSQTPQVNVAFGNTLRTYRLALAGTVEFSTHYGTTKATALSAMVTRINNINAIFARDLSIRLSLIANTDDLIYLTEPDPYTDTNRAQLIEQNQMNCDAVIGNANYDVGHVFGKLGGGGLAALGSTCNNQNKGRACSSTIPALADLDDVTTHEFGHQFGAAHTFNGTQGNCNASNYMSEGAVEPGSGNTLMSYLGRCGSDDLIPFSTYIMYFHGFSIGEIFTHLINSPGNTCGTVTNTGNQIPSLQLHSPVGKTIPISTPYELRGSGFDPDGNPVWLTWEQVDAGGPPGPPNVASRTTGPITRSFTPTVSGGIRSVPALEQLINNTSIAGNLLGTATRTMNFKLTGRDLNPTSGGVIDLSYSFQVTSNAGPFMVTNPNSAPSLLNNSPYTVQWHVANTNLAPVSCSQVNIRLSTDGGNTFPILLAENTPNDGSQSVTIPAGINSANCRIRVEAADNIFFDISNQNFSIKPANDYCRVESNCQALNFARINQITVYPGNNAYAANLTNPFCDGSGYFKSDETASPGKHVFRGRSYYLSMSTISAIRRQQIGLWVDLNNDTDFDDPGEFIRSFILDPGQSSPNFTFTLPGNCQLGPTNFRIRNIRSNNVFQANQSCLAADTGQTLDYVLNVKGVCTASATCLLEGAPTYISKISINLPNPPPGSQPIFDRNSDCSSGGYSYSNFSTGSNKRVLKLGTSYRFSMNTTTAYPQGVGIWIDYNDDGDFDDAGEFLFGSEPNQNGVFSTVKNILPQVVTGFVSGPKTIRFRSGYQTTFSSGMACSPVGFGETEDIAVWIDGYPFASSTCNDVDFGVHYISTVTFAGKTTTSVCSEQGYSLNIDSVEQRWIYTGQSISGNMTVAGGNPSGKAIWLDKNNDGDFDDAGEYVASSQGIGPNSFSFSFPTTGMSDGTYRIRFRSAYNAVPAADQSATNFGFGETEDYEITLKSEIKWEQIQPSYCSGGFYNVYFQPLGKFAQNHNFTISLVRPTSRFTIGSGNSSPILISIPESELPTHGPHYFSISALEIGGFFATESFSNNFTIIPKPTVNSMVPTSGPPGTQVVLTGSGFTPGMQISLGQYSANDVIVGLDGNSVVFTVPQGAITGPVSLSGACFGTGPVFTVLENNNCSLSLSPNIELVRPTAAVCENGSISVQRLGDATGTIHAVLKKATGFFFQYQILQSKNQPDAGTSDRYTFTGLSEGFYRVILTNQNDCADSTTFLFYSLACNELISDVQVENLGYIESAKILFKAHLSNPVNQCRTFEVTLKRRVGTSTFFAPVPGAQMEYAGFGNTYMFGQVQEGEYRIVYRSIPDGSYFCTDSVSVYMPSVAPQTQVTPPIPSLEPGNYQGPIQLWFTNTTPNALHYYTTNGQDPVIGTPYTVLADGLFPVPVTSTLKVMAVKAGLANSVIVTLNYVIGSPGIVAKPIISPATATYNGTQQLNIYCETADSEIWYTTNGMVPVPGTSFTKLYPPADFNIFTSTTIRALATKPGWINSSVDVSYITINNPQVVANPVFSPNSGTYQGSVTVTISTVTPDATIYFTTNGNTPVPGTSFTFEYTGPFIRTSVSNTIKARAVRTGWQNSAVVSANYTITEPSVVATPVISPNGGLVEQRFVSITCATPTSYIYYTTNGNTPVVGTSFTKLYNGPFWISQSTTVKAIAIRALWVNSPVVTAVFTVINPVVKVANPEFFPGSSVFTQAASVTISCPTPDAQIYYTTNGNNPELIIPNSFTKLYIGAITLHSTTQIKAIAVKTGLQNSNVVSATYSFPSPLIVANPVISPNGGTFPLPQVVSMSTITPGATIYYTTNGNTPRLDVPNSFTFEYTGAFVMANSRQIRAIAVKSGMKNSSVTVANFTIGGAARAAVDETDVETELEKISVFPNPSASGLFNVLLPASEDESVFYSVIAMDGKEIQAGMMTSGHSQTLDLSSFPTGLYQLKIQSERRMQVLRLVKE